MCLPTEWTIQRHWEHWEHKTHHEDKQINDGIYNRQLQNKLKEKKKNTERKKQLTNV